MSGFGWSLDLSPHFKERAEICHKAVPTPPMCQYRCSLADVLFVVGEGVMFRMIKGCLGR